MILRNPTSEDVSIVFRGTEYSIEAGAAREIPEEAAKHWKKSIHQFLIEEEASADVLDSVNSNSSDNNSNEPKATEVKKEVKDPKETATQKKAREKREAKEAEAKAEAERLAAEEAAKKEEDEKMGDND